MSDNDWKKAGDMEKRKIAAGIGEVLWDMLPSGPKPGGAPANFAYHISRMGFDGHVVSAVGDDASGRELTEIFKDRKISADIQTVPFPTGRVEVKVDTRGIPEYDIKENVAWDNIVFTDKLEQLASEASAVCFGTLACRTAVSRATIRRFLNAAGDACLKIYDINLRQDFWSPEIIEGNLAKTDILKINDDEMKTVAGVFSLCGDCLEDYSETLMRRYGLKMLVLTCGTDGSHVFVNDGSHSFLPTPKVDVADTVGAGDSFTAAFVAAVLSGKPVAEAHAFAVGISAYVCSCEGAMPALPQSLLAGLA